MTETTHMSSLLRDRDSMNRSLCMSTSFFSMVFKLTFKSTTLKSCLKLVRGLGMGPASAVGWKGGGVFVSSQLGN